MLETFPQPSWWLMRSFRLVVLVSFLALLAGPACGDANGDGDGGGGTADGSGGDGAADAGAEDGAIADDAGPGSDSVTDPGGDDDTAGGDDDASTDMPGDAMTGDGAMGDDDATLHDDAVMLDDTGDATGTGGDATEDTEDSGPTEPEIPEPDVVAEFSNCSEPGGDRNIYDLQDPQCPDHFFPEPQGKPGHTVAMNGVVVTAVFGDTFFIQEKNGGPFSGIAVFSTSVYFGDLVPGDEVNVTGAYYEFFEASQIVLDEFELIGPGTAPAPFEIAHPSHIATNGPLAEMFEGVFVRVTDVGTIHTKPDCPHEFGEFMVTGDLRVDDMSNDKWDAKLGDWFTSITGVLHYTFGNHKLEPRFEADYAWTEKGGTGGESKCIEADCIEPASKFVSRQVVVNEVMADPYGDDNAQEWFELYNNTGEPVSLAGWTVKDCADQQLVLPSLVIQPGEMVVIGSEMNMALNGGVPVDGGYASPFYLPNTIGALLLYNESGVLIDQTRYSLFSPWEALEVGHSMERISPNADGTEPESWETATQTFGESANFGTPGEWNDAAD